MELRAAGGRASQIEAPRLHGVLVDRPQYPFGVGVGALTQVERLVLGRVHGVGRLRLAAQPDLPREEGAFGTVVPNGQLGPGWSTHHTSIDAVTARFHLT